MKKIIVMPNNKPILWTFLIMLLSGATTAQKSDWGIWSSVGLEANLTKKWQLEGDIEYRLKDGVSQTDQLRGAIGISYDLIKQIKLFAGYQLISDFKKSGNNEYRNRFKLLATGSYKLAGFTASLRTGVQGTFSDVADEEELDNATWVYRNRFGLKYKIPGIRLHPYATFEMYHRLSEGTDPSHYKNRYGIGLEYDINKHNQIDVGYRRDNEIKDSKDYSFDALAVGYIYSF